MPDTKLPEVWLRGQLPGIPSLLQPVAHALLQAKDEVSILMENFPGELLWEKPAGVASPAFHLQHLSGVLDRLFTYASGQALSQQQLQQLQNEGVRKDDITAKILVQAFHQQIDKALEQLKATDEKTLNDFRGVGRAQLPSTVIGLLVHGAEHTMRHLGQLLVTVRILKAGI
jgi:uncharacterized damage-inducible protein DinB